MDVDRRALKKSLRTDFDPSLRVRLVRLRLRLRQASHLPALLRGATITEPVFIIGAPRSGTSMLNAILRTSSRLAHFAGEAHEIWEADFHPALRGWDSNVLDETDITPEVAARINRSLVLVTGGRRRLIDKTPRNSFRVGFLRGLWPDARFIHLRRDGRDNVNSLINAWRTPRYRTYEVPGGHSIPGTDPKWWKFVLYPGWREDVRGPLEVVCAKQWVLANRYAVDSFQGVDPAHVIDVTYEGLVDDPVGEVKRLLEFLDFPFEDQVRAKASALATTPYNVVTPPERNKWRRENPREIEAVRHLIEPMMGELGYATQNL